MRTKYTYFSLLKSLYIFILALLVCIPCNEANAQEQQATTQQVKQQKTKAATKTKKAKTKSKPKKRLTNTAIREEIQRYIGYEPLPIRYLSLPYDATMNTNQHGGFVDIGFILLLFIPIILLLGFVNKPVWGLVSAFLCLTILVSSVSTPYLQIENTTDPTVVISALDKFIAENNFSSSPVSITMAHINKGIFQLKKPIHNLVYSISGEKDHFTYPMLMLLFAGVFFLFQHRIEQLSIVNRSMLNLLLLFGFLSLLLTAGIIWYAFPFFALATLLTTAKMMDLKGNKSLLNKISLGIFAAATVIWIGMGYLFRIANNKMTTKQNAVNLFDSSVARYQTGVFNKKETFNSFYPNSSNALSIINSEDESLIYKVGTTLTFLIEKNDRRVFHDNQLGTFQQLINKYPDKAVLTEVFKASGYKYLLVDLKTHALDKTPEQSLKKKFNQLMGFLYQNPGLQLLGTNQMVEKADGTREYKVFGNVKFQGNYAIFQIK